MTTYEMGSLIRQLLLLLAAAHLLGSLFVRLRQPRVVGEILAGLLLGPSVLGRLAPGLSQLLLPAGLAKSPEAVVLHFVYWLGLLLLMFISGVESRQLFARSDRAATAWLAVVGTGLPFGVVLGAGPFLPLDRIVGPAGHRGAALLVVGIAIAVTSIPVISRIFHDLGILDTRFASLVLGVAVVEDIALWVVLALATALASAGTLDAGPMISHTATTLLYFAVGFIVGPALLQRARVARWNVVASSSPVGWALLVMLAYAAVAASFDVNLVFAAFLAGFGLRSHAARPQADAVEAIGKFSFAIFIPTYFALVGYKIDLGSSFSFTSLALFLLLACAVKILAMALGARLAGFTSRDALNLAIATNARGGPGIILASVALEAGIINAAFYTTLVLLAVLTSQAAGVWLEFVLRRGWPLLSGDATAVPEALAERSYG